MAASESNYGNAPGNELFGIKALPGQPGTSLQTHEGPYGGTTQNATFASYNSPMDAVNAFVDLIQNHYPGAVGAQTLDDFVHGLKQGGYFTAAEDEYKGILQGIQGRIGDAVDAALSGAQGAATGAVQAGQQAVQKATQAVTGQPDTTGMVFPVVGYQGNVNDHWGSVTGGSDIMADRGTPVVAMESGKVVESGFNKIGGNSVLIQGDDGNQYYYAHFDAAPSVQVGDQIKAGTFLGPVGNTGDASGGPTHLHIGIGPSILLGNDKYGGTGGDYDAVGLLRSVLSGSQGSGQSTSSAAGPQAIATPSKPTTTQPSANEPTYMSTMQPATGASQPAAGQSLIDQLLHQGQNTVGGAFSALGSTAQGALGGAQDLLSQAGGTAQQQVQNAVQNAGGTAQNALNTGQGLLNTAATDVTQAPQTLNDLLTQNALMSAGIPVAQGAQNLPSYLQGLVSPTQDALGSALNTALSGPSQNISDILGSTQAQDLLSNPLVQQVSGQILGPMLGMPNLGGARPMPSTLDAMQTIQDLTNKYAGTAGSSSIPMAGQAPLTLGVDPSVMTPEDRDAYNQARVIVSGMSMGAPTEGGIPSPSGITPGQWLGGLFRGGIVSSPSTMLDVASNSAIMPLISYLTGSARDVLGAVPDIATGQGLGPTAARLYGRNLGTATGLNQAADTFLSQLKPETLLSENPLSLIGRAQPGPEQLAAYLGEGAGALHGAMSQAARQPITSGELGAVGAELGAGQGLSGQDLQDFVRNFIANPPDDAKAAAEGVAARATATQNLGWLAGGIGQGVAKIPDPIGSALFPVYRKGMQIASRMAEFTPGLGLTGSVIDAARGKLGYGPYAAGLGSTPVDNAVGPLAERLANNAIGTALGLWLASKADIHQPGGATITGSWQGLTPDQQDALRASGQMPNGVQFPDGSWHDWSKVPPAFRGPLMLAGAYGDSQRAYDQAALTQQFSGPNAYGVEDPRWAQAHALLNEISTQFVNQTPLRNLSSAVDLLTGGSNQKGLQPLVDLPSSILSGLVPGSAVTRSVAEATDPLERQALRPETMSQVLPAILQNVQQNLPGLREQLPARVDVMGRDIQNPLQGIAGLLPLHPAAGQPSPVLAAMAAAGVAPSAPPPSIPYGPNAQINLRPDEQQTYERYRGQLLDQYAGPMVASPAFQQLPDYAQRRALGNVLQNVDAAAGRMLLGDLAPTAQDRLSIRGALAPVMPYGPSGLDVMTQMRNHAAQRALVQALLSQSA